ncbi:MAG: hypothetical protein ACXVAY_17255 [Mucilaginibacter sp.]
MKHFALLLFLAVIKLSAFSADRDTLSLQSSTSSIIDSLKQQLNTTGNDSLKAGVYTRIADQYLKYDTITDKKKKLYYQNQALNFTMLALHGYSRYNDTVGLIVTFNNLARVYRSQRKFSQAKWFILQSNTLSRERNDQANIIASLTELAGIKMDIKDYSLAMRDLDEALQLSAVNRFPLAEASVQQSYALLYSHLKKYDKEAIAMRRYNAILDSIKKGEEAKLTAKLNAQNLAQRKKKLNLISYKRPYKTNFAKKTSSI